MSGLVRISTGKKGMRTATFQFSEPGASLNGPDLFIELPTRTSGRKGLDVRGTIRPKKSTTCKDSVSELIHTSEPRLNREGVSKQRVTTFAWQLGSQYDVAATRGADSVAASDCRAQFGRPSTRRGCRICVTVRLLVRPRGETMYWQANANAPFPSPPF